MAESFDAWAERLAAHVREKSRAAAKPTCETCNDEGVTMTMVCYGGPPVERDCYCPDCGSGDIIEK